MYVIFNVIQFLNPDYNFCFEDLDNDAPRINGHYVSIKQDPVNLFCFFVLGAITHRYRLERSNSLGPMRVFFPMCYLRFIENKTKQVVERVLVASLRTRCNQPRIDFVLYDPSIDKIIHIKGGGKDTASAFPKYKWIYYY